MDEAIAFRRAFGESLEEILIDPLFQSLSPLFSSDVKERIVRFAELVVESNRSLNLTAITSPFDVAAKHVADSLTCFLVAEWPQGASVCDVGTGAGFPGMVLAIARPDLVVTLMDSVAKKLAFLTSAAESVGVRVMPLHARAEDAGRDKVFREHFDLVVARAVARLPVLAEYCLPLCRIGGWFVAMKGPDGPQELKEAEAALKILGGSVGDVRKVVLPLGAGERTLIAVRKERPTPGAYPRRAGVPGKRPLR